MTWSGVSAIGDTIFKSKARQPLRIKSGYWNDTISVFRNVFPLPHTSSSKKKTKTTLQHLCKMIIMCLKGDYQCWCWMPSKTLTAKGERKARDAAALQSVVLSRGFLLQFYFWLPEGEDRRKNTEFRKRNCILAEVLNIFWENPPSSCNLCNSKRELLIF